MLEHFKRTQAVKVSLCVHLIFMAHCGVRELHCCYTVFNIQKIYSFHLEVFQMWLFGSVIRELSGPCSAHTEYVISMQVIQEYICCL